MQCARHDWHVLNMKRSDSSALCNLLWKHELLEFSKQDRVCLFRISRWAPGSRVRRLVNPAFRSVVSVQARERGNWIPDGWPQPDTGGYARSGLTLGDAAERSVPPVICHVHSQLFPALDQVGSRRVALRLHGTIRRHQRQHVRPPGLYFTLQILWPLGKK